MHVCRKYNSLMDLTAIFDNIGSYLLVVLISALPVVELKGAIPFGLACGLGLWETFVCALIGSCLPAPFIMLLIRRFLKWAGGCKIKWLNRFAAYLENKIQRKSNGKHFRTSALVGLFVFVAIPLPSTGVWTGSMIAGALDLRLKHAIPAVVLGNLIAGLIILLMSNLIIL